MSNQKLNKRPSLKSSSLSKKLNILLGKYKQSWTAYKRNSPGYQLIKDYLKSIYSTI